MVKKKVQISKYVISDFITASAVWILFNILRYHEIASYFGYSSLKSYLLSSMVLEGQLIVPFYWIFIYYLSGYYNKPFGKSRIIEFFTTFLTVLIGVTILFFIMILNDLPRSFHIYYELYFSLLAIQFILTYLPRLIITQSGINKVKRREWASNVLIIGAGEKALGISKKLYDLGYSISGFIPENESTGIKVDKNRIAGELNNLSVIIADKRVDELVVALECQDTDQLMTVLYSLYRYKLPVKISADKFSMLSKTTIKTIRDIPLVDVTDNNLSEVERNIKFVMDKIVSIIALILLSPLFLYIAFRIKMDSSGSVFFTQERIGYMGKPFKIYKFRTMKTGSEKNGPLLSSKNDDRVTTFGRVMRKYRLDELPQFWNVLKGDMSLVGPRPERKYFIDQIVKKAPYYYLLHNVRPGITSMGMVKYGYAGDVDGMVKRLGYDMIYYENMSLILDITILIYTVKTVITGKGI